MISRLSHIIALSALIFCLQACTEGGTAGTGGIVAPPQLTTKILISGKLNKGPLVKESVLELVRLSDNGTPIQPSYLSHSLTSDGEYEIVVNDIGPFSVTAKGQYLSEISGQVEGEITLNAIFNIEQSTERKHVNLLTTLTSPRIRVLLADAVPINQAIAMAESELTLSLSSLTGPYQSSRSFTSLTLISGLEINPSHTGNAYLLSLSSMFEQLAQTESQLTVLTSAQYLQQLLNTVAEDLRQDGDIDNVTFISRLSTAATELNSHRILANLFRGIPSLREDDSAGNLTDDRAITSRLNLFTVIADLDLFLDTDGDGIFNRDDVDDDNDGVLDDADTSPYGN